MAHKNKAKGTYHENQVLEWFTKLGIPTKKVPLSGSLGGEYSGDLWATVLGCKLVTEVKYRSSTRLPNAFAVLEDRDMAILRRKAGRSTEQVVIMSERTFTRLMKEQTHEPQIHTDSGDTESD